MSVGPRTEKFNIVSNDHGCTQKYKTPCISLSTNNIKSKMFSTRYTKCKIFLFQRDISASLRES